MKAVITAIALTVGATVATMNMTQPVQAGHNYSQECDVDDGWDSGWDRTCKKNKRKCVEIASTLAYNMAQSGAYAELNDDDFARFAIYVASHIVDNAYDHDEVSPLDPVFPLGQ